MADHPRVCDATAPIVVAFAGPSEGVRAVQVNGVRRSSRAEREIARYFAGRPLTEDA